MATNKLTEESVRIHLMDKPELNSLLRGVRWTSKDIEQAMIHCVSYFNESLPSCGQNFTVESFPHPFTLLTGVCGHLLRSAAVHQANNSLNYSADGVQVQENDKASVFAQMGSTYWEEFKGMVLGIKMQQHLNAAFGSVASEFPNR
jgi:hypothetical protein